MIEIMTLTAHHAARAETTNFRLVFLRQRVSVVCDSRRSLRGWRASGNAYTMRSR